MTTDALNVLKPGTYTFGPSDATVLVRTGREGVAARLGHDLVLEVSRWTASITVAGDLANSHVTATFDAGSLVVREGSGGARPLSDKDMSDIQHTAAEKVLQSHRHPSITFESTAIETGASSQVTLLGDLTIAGHTRPIRFPLGVEPDEGATRVTGSLALIQSEWGITPYSALMGTLKVSDRLEISIDGRVSPG